MERWIEGLTDRIYDLEPSRAEGLEKLLFDHVDSLDDSRGVGRRRVHVREARDIIERLKELPYQVGLRTRSDIGALLRCPFAIVVVLRRQPQVPLPLARQVRR